MNKLMHKRVFGKKGFTILELLVVVAIIAILAVIAVPQFMGAIEKSRVSAQIADINAVSKAATMYNFDNSKYPIASADLTNGATTYINAFPAASKWDNGAFEYVVVTDIAADTENIANGELDTATATATGLVVGDVVLHVGSVPAEQVTALEVAIDQDASATPANQAKLGMFRFDGTDAYYTIGKN